MHTLLEEVSLDYITTRPEVITEWMKPPSQDVTVRKQLNALSSDHYPKLINKQIVTLMIAAKEGDFSSIPCPLEILIIVILMPRVCISLAWTNSNIYN